MLEINKSLLDRILAQAEASERKRMNYDLRTDANDGTQRMLNALMPGTQVPIHRHPNSNENVILVCGKLEWVVYEEGDLGPSKSPLKGDLKAGAIGEGPSKSPFARPLDALPLVQRKGDFKAGAIGEGPSKSPFARPLDALPLVQRKGDLKAGAIGTLEQMQEAFPQGMDAQDVTLGRRLRETARYLLDPSVGNFGCVVPKGAWHTVEVLEPSVIYEAKDGRYGEDGSEIW